MKIKLIIVKAYIKGLASEGQRTRKFINRSVKEQRDSFWHMKRQIGTEARNYLLAYGLLRNIPYSSMEKKCRVNNKPNVEAIMNIIHAVLGHYYAREWTHNKIKALLTHPTSESTEVIKKAV